MKEHNNHLPNLQTLCDLIISPWFEFAGFSVTSVRHKSKSSRSKNLGGKRNTVGKAYGIKKNDGCFVHKGEILVNQCGLRFYPGENVRVLNHIHHENYLLSIKVHCEVELFCSGFFSTCIKLWYTAGTVCFRHKKFYNYIVISMN